MNEYLEQKDVLSVYNCDDVMIKRWANPVVPVLLLIKRTSNISDNMDNIDESRPHRHSFNVYILTDRRILISSLCLPNLSQ